MNCDTSKLLVVTPGSTNTRCGWAGSDLPTHVFPSTLGRIICSSWANELDDNGKGGRWFQHPGGEKTIWDEQERLEVTSAEQHIHNDFIVDPAASGKDYYIDRFQVPSEEEILNHCLLLLGSPQDQKDFRIFLTPDRLWPTRSMRKQYLQTIFERFEFAGCHLSVKAPLPLYTIGSLTGTVILSGTSETDVVCVSDGHVVQESARILNLGGRNITRQLCTLLLLSGYSFHRSKVSYWSFPCLFKSLSWFTYPK